jgi:hypothetical protein
LLAVAIDKSLQGESPLIPPSGSDHSFFCVHDGTRPIARV